MRSTDKELPILFVTGSDTGVGKTTLSVMLIKELASRGYRISTLKPVETGCKRSGAELIAADAALLNSAAGGKTPLSETVPYRFEQPIAPQAAAEAAGEAISIESLLEHSCRSASAADLLLIEGAGGLLVPIYNGYTFADFAASLRAKVLVVVGSKLGCINHALLTFEVLKARGLDCVGYVLNDLFAADTADISLQSNRTLLQSLAASRGIDELLFLPHQAKGEPPPETVSVFAEKVANLFGIIKCRAPST